MWLKNGPFCNKVNFHKRAKSKVCFDFISQSHSNQLFSIPLCIKREKKRDKEWGKKIKKFFEESVSEKKERKKSGRGSAEWELKGSWKEAERRREKVGVAREKRRETKRIKSLKQYSVCHYIYSFTTFLYSILSIPFPPYTFDSLLI